MADSAGLQQEQKCFEAVYALQSRGWSFNGFTILKFERTYKHLDKRIRKLDGRKFDLVILFRHRNLEDPLVFVLQVKSTQKSYNHFKNSPTKQKIKCILVRPRESLKDVMIDLDAIFKEVLMIDHEANEFLRPELLKLFQ